MVISKEKTVQSDCLSFGFGTSKDFSMDANLDRSERGSGILTRKSSIHDGITSSKPTSDSWCFTSILVLTVICVILACCVPSTEAGYAEQFLESVEVCAAGSFGTFGALPGGRKKIRLANFPNNTVSVRITRWEDLYASFFNYRCRFEVTAPKNMGVMVVVQSMRLRKSKKISCRDYIQFQQDDGYKTSQICGEVEKYDNSKIPERILGPRKFYDPKGEMDVTFFTDARDEGVEDPISLHLVFTAYKECTPASLLANQVRQCSSLRSHSCIASNLFCDGVINCGFNDDDFGADEQNCDGMKIGRGMDEVDRSVSIYVFAITTVATLVIVVIFSLIVCCCLRKFSKQRREHSRNHAHGYGHGPGGSSSSAFPHIHHHHSSPQSGMAPDIIRLNTTGPSAPLRSTEPSPEKYPVVDMDQPPPYDALFPTSKTPPSAPQLTMKPSKNKQ